MAWSLKAGHGLHVSTRTPSKAVPLVEAGAILHDDPGSAAAEADIVITIVGLPGDVEAIYLGEGGIIERAKALLRRHDDVRPLPRRIHDARPRGWRHRCAGLGR